MRGNKPMNETITFRASGEEIAAYSRTWRQLGFKSESEFHRTAGNNLVSGYEVKSHGVNPIILTEINTHLNRIGSSLMELVILSSNDNFPDSTLFSRALNEALLGIKAIRRKVS
ncbi:hypothetical protein [Magnetovibrio blakemorei]|uniref:Uncharacterized protein n=1 Tax=Magnetovibrio blakemorei TaxID=28181 RepID=A0A1E5Q4V1_9PROT|nr:hypothetical protein [Magnetovibrio blakemorei]OEJ65264.1 hypothetical protein BEN30_15035 [Magnetovibrio blakemorei]